MSSRIFVACALLSCCLGLASAPLAAQDAAADAKSIGYFLGVSMGQQMKGNGLKLSDLDLDSLRAGFLDGISDKAPSMTDDELKATAGKFQALMVQRSQELLATKLVENETWLAANAKKEGVKSLEQGLQYKVIKAGSGESPSSVDTVRVHYTGRLTDGSVFDSSVQRGEPAEFAVGRVIPGWTMALQKMKVGDKWELYIPSQLAYGERGSQGAIGPNEILVFEVELLDIL